MSESIYCECPEGPLTDEDVAAFGGDTEDDGEEFCWRCRKFTEPEKRLRWTGKPDRSDHD